MPMAVTSVVCPLCARPLRPLEIVCRNCGAWLDWPLRTEEALIQGLDEMTRLVLSDRPADAAGRGAQKRSVEDVKRSLREIDRALARSALAGGRRPKRRMSGTGVVAAGALVTAVGLSLDPGRIALGALALVVGGVAVALARRGPGQ